MLDHHRIPAPGGAALMTDNLTMASTNVPRAAIDSRAWPDRDVPDPELHGTTIAAAMRAKRPVVVVFATPQFCTSRFCGPVTDLVAELAKVDRDRASFIHVEIWRDFQATTLNKGAADWLLRNGDLNEPGSSSSVPTEASSPVSTTSSPGASSSPSSRPFRIGPAWLWTGIPCTYS